MAVVPIFRLGTNFLFTSYEYEYEYLPASTTTTTTTTTNQMVAVKEVQFQQQTSDVMDDININIDIDIDIDIDNDSDSDDTAEVLDADVDAKVGEGDNNDRSNNPPESQQEVDTQDLPVQMQQSKSKSKSNTNKAETQTHTDDDDDDEKVQVQDANANSNANAAAETEKPPSESLIPCEVLMQTNPEYSDGAFLTRNTTEVVWKKRADQSRELTLPSTCLLKRYTAAQAGRCLKNKNLFFVGDSLTRYQFTSFAYFLEHEEYPKRFHAMLHPCDDHIDENGEKTCSKPEEPNVAAEVDWVPYGSWKGYYLSLGGGRFNGTKQMKNFLGRMEVASIRRDKSDEAPDEPTYPISDYLEYTTSTERYTATTTAAAAATNGDGDGDEQNNGPPGFVRVTSLFEGGTEGNEPMQGFRMTGCGSTGTCNYTAEEFEERERRALAGDYDWDCANIVHAFGPDCEEFQAMHPDPINYMIYNRGIWGRVGLEKAEQMMSSMHRMIGGEKGRRESNNRCFFKSTTGNANTEYLKEYESGPVRDATLGAGCEFMDVFHVTEEFAKIGRDHEEFANVFWDVNHYTPWVYEELNNLLLNLLCNTEQSSS